MRGMCTALGWNSNSLGGEKRMIRLKIEACANKGLRAWVGLCGDSRQRGTMTGKRAQFPSCKMGIWLSHCPCFFFLNCINKTKLFFLVMPGACEMLVPQPGIGPAPPALEVWDTNYWTTREVPHNDLWYKIPCQVTFHVISKILRRQKSSSRTYSFSISLLKDKCYL